MEKELVVRTDAEVLARIEEIAGGNDDWMGFRREVLMENLSFEAATPFLNEGVTEEEWNFTPTPETVLARAVDYYAFALTKIIDHRGISASRSVDKLREYAWLLGRDDVVEAMDEVDYENYGAPKVRAFGVGFELPYPNGQEPLSRMAAGLECDPNGCEDGCGS